MSFEFKLSDANAKILNTAGKYLTDNINIMLDKAAVEGKIVEGQTILGVTGTAKKIKTQDKKEVTISAKTATITPDSGYYSMASLKYTVADAAYAINGGGLTGGSAVTPTVTLSLGNSDLTTSGNEATNIYSGTSGATLYDSEAAAKTAGYNYFLEINGASSATSSTVSRDAMLVKTSKAGWINSGDSATVNQASKTVTVNAGSKKKFVGVKARTVTYGGGTLTSTAAAAVSVSAPTVTRAISGTALTGISDTSATPYGITATKPTSGTDGTNYLTFSPSGSKATGSATATATSTANITAITCTEKAGYTADGTHTCKSADSKSGSDTTSKDIVASVSDGKSYYMPIVGVSFTAGTVSGSTDVGAGNATLSTSNISGVSITSSGSASVSAAKYSNSAGAIASHSSATASGTAASTNLTSATKYITGVTIGAGKSFSLTNNTTTSTTNINGGKTTTGGLTMVGKVATIYTGTNQSVSVTDTNGTLKTGSVKLNAVTISQGTTTATMSAGTTADNDISSKCTASASAPSDGYFAKLTLASPKVTGTATGTTTAGWISSNPASASVTVNAGSGTAYVKVPTGSTTTSASVISSPVVTVSGSTNMATVNSGTYYFTVSATKTDGKVKGSATIKEGYQPAGTKTSGEVAVAPTISGSGTKHYVPSASTTLYSNTSNSTSGFKTTKTYENVAGYIPAGAKTAYTSTIDTVSGTGTITAVPSGATVNITSNAGTTTIAANTGTVNFVNWKLCNNAADACLDIYF